jgi:hypothetical protein
VVGVILAPGERVAGEQPPQGPDVDSPPGKRGLEAAPAAAMRRFETQVDGGREGIRREDGVSEFE